MRGVYFEDGQVVLREVSGPPNEGRKVRVRSTGICGSDLHMLKMGFPGTFVAGHEIAGVLEDGTPVTVEPIIPCGKCEYCRSGSYNLCPGAVVLGIARDGGMAEEVIAPDRCLVRLPATVDVKDACLVEPLAVAIHGLRQAGMAADQRVAVIGGGTIGLCAVAYARASGAEAGLAARYDHQAGIGRKFGAGEIAGRYDLVVECVGTDQTIKQAVKLCRPGGKVLILGTYWGEVSFPQLSAMMKEVTVVNSYMYAGREGRRDFDLAVNLMAENPEIASSIITHRFPLDEAEKAFTVARDRKAGAVKVVLEP